MPYLFVTLLAAAGIALFLRMRRPTFEYPLPESLIIQPESDLALDVRIIQLEGAVNFRDVGGYRTKDGYRVKSGMVYRSAALGQLTEQDWMTMQRLNLSVICDLRSDEEVQTEPDQIPLDVSYHHLSVKAEPPRFARLRGLFFNQKQFMELLPYVYRTLLIDRNARVFGATLRLLADADNLPIVIHCTAGKDRTGVATALLLMLLGVPDEVITADYSLSNYYYDRFYEVAAIALKPLSVLGFKADDVVPLLTANVRTMQGMIDHIRVQYGSVEAYLTGAAGMTPDELARIKSNLIER